MILVGWLLTGTSCASPIDRESALESLIAAERSFARTAERAGVREAFIAYLADDGVLFRPRPVNAQAYLRDQAPTPGTLSWQPALVDVAHSDDLGFSTGPWEYRREPGAEPVAYGQFFSIWKRQTDGSWRVALDHGTSNPRPDSIPDEVKTPTPPPYSDEWAASAGGGAAARDRLLEIDRTFSATSAARGFFHALTSYASADIRALRNGRPPLAGVDELRELAVERNGRLTWTPQDGGVSLSGDVGYTYGEYRYISPADGSEETGVYVRAWRRVSDESWRVVVDLMTPLAAG